MEVLQAFPDLILAMAISMAIGTGLPAVIVAIAITRLPFGGRVIRSVAITVREMPYVEAGARQRARPRSASCRRHVLPQCVAPYLVLATTHLGVAIVIEAALGFLGVGVPAAHRHLGQHARRRDHRPRSRSGGSCSSRALAITVTVLAFNLLGDGIRDTLDPRLSPAFLRLVTGAGRAGARADAGAGEARTAVAR